MFPRATASLTLSSQRAETKDHIITNASALTSGEFAGSRVSNELGLAALYVAFEMKKNRTGMDECLWEKKGISSHINNHALRDWLKQKSGSKKRN